MICRISQTLEGIGVCDGALDVEVSYHLYPAEPMVRYYPDGSGYPGAPAEIELHEVVATAWHVNGRVHKRCQHWIWLLLDVYAQEAIECDWERFMDNVAQQVEDN